MSDERISTLPADVRALVDADLRSPGMPDDARQRVLRRMNAGFLAAGVVVAGAAAAGSSVAAKSGAGAFTALSAIFARKTAWLVTAAFFLGGTVGAGGLALVIRVNEARRAQAPSPPTTIVVASRAPIDTPTTAALTSPIEPPPVISQPIEPVAAPPTLALAPTPSVASTAPVTKIVERLVERDVELSSERTLLERARSALGHGAPLQALDAVAKHAAKFPNGQLTEEREDIAVHALVAAGRLDEARARAARFHQRFPKSIFLPAIDAAIGAPP